MKTTLRLGRMLMPLAALVIWAGAAGAALFVQCPGDMNKDAIPDPFILDSAGNPTATPNPRFDTNVACMHVTGGDGFVKMADGSDMYMFGFGNYTGQRPLQQVVANQALKAMAPAPLITLRQGQEFYLTLTNVGMVKRPDLFDPHSVHWHGYPNAAPIFDGLPEPSPTPIMGASFSYYYKAAVPGTYFWHCHVEAAEHMQMGMIGNLWVHPGQNYLANGTLLGSWTHSNAGDVDMPPFGNFPNQGSADGDIDLNGNGIFDEGAHDRYAYNDGDGSTRYDVDYPVQLTGFDSNFHKASLGVAALPFANMKDDYPMINGRGYPETVNPNPIQNQEGFAAQTTPSIIQAASGQKILLRVSNVSTTDLWAITTTLGVPMKVVGRGAALLCGPSGQDTSFEVHVLNVGGGQAFDVIINTAGVPAGTYFLYTTNLQFLANGEEERGGLMTEIRIN